MLETFCGGSNSGDPTVRAGIVTVEEDKYALPAQRCLALLAGSKLTLRHGIYTLRKLEPPQ